MPIYVSDITLGANPFSAHNYNTLDASFRVTEPIDFDNIEERFNQAFLGNAIAQCRWCSSGNAHDNGNCVQCGGPI